ncbi:ribbon-helix-helix domain-containing protein [Kordiimonas pumila]|uniref:Ribbon-helix-helix domain-containing protein n=1 Tax=Kordiimonas pumila TaxID=2161677 RepID=A0ABV7D5A8_9PROT|nr:ribbon-helix-helix domain-containing protein [Kordiimonas pumila]
MLHTISLRIPSTLSHELEELAARRNLTVSALMRDILLEYTGHKSSDFKDIHERLQVALNLSIKTLYLVRFLAAGVDEEAADEILREAENYFVKIGLDNSQVETENDHG